jgi:hypothetical protein
VVTREKRRRSDEANTEEKTKRRSDGPQFGTTLSLWLSLACHPHKRALREQSVE